MSQESLDVTRAADEAWNAGNLDALRELWDSYVVVRTTDEWPERGILGREAALRWAKELRDTWDNAALETISRDDAGDRVVVRQILRGTGHGPASKIETTTIATVRRGKIILLEYFWDHAEALEALELSDRAKSQENVAIYREYVEGILAGTSGLDSDATISKMATYWDPRIEQDTSGGPVPELSGVYRGIEAVRQWWKEWFGAWETMQAEFELVGAGNRVVFLLDLRMRGRSSGVEVALGKHAWVTTFRDGLMTHTKLYMSQSGALEAVGLSEQDAQTPPDAAA